MVGTNVANYPDTVARVYREGHQVANHSYDHADLTELSDSSVRSQIQRTNALLDLACGKGSTYLVRAPYGNTNARVRAAVGRSAGLLVGGSRRLEVPQRRDGKEQNCEGCLRRSHHSGS